MVIICDYCGQYVCPSSCPSYSGELISVGSAKGRCYFCDGYVHKGDGHHIHNERILCEECASELIPSELLEYLDCDNIEDFFDLLW